MTTLVTGATGFIGSAVARVLAAAGHRLRLLVREGSDRRNLEGIDCETVTGDLTDGASLRAAVDGCDTLFHVAADYRLWVPDPDLLYRINVEGTRLVMAAAADAGVRRIVHTSSVATLGINADRSPADEETPVREADMIGHYKRSKFLAEQLVRGMVRERGLPAVIVNPSAPVGPRDIRPTPTGRMIAGAAAGRIPAYVDTGLNVAHVDDIARGHLLALEQGRPGECYILGGENMSLREILVTIAGFSGRRPPLLRLPHGLLLPVAFAAEAMARLTGREPGVTLDGVRLSRKYMYFSTAKAVRELGYTARPAVQAIADAVDWFGGRDARDGHRLKGDPRTGGGPARAGPGP